MVHWRYMVDELRYRWRRTGLVVVGIALTVAMVVLLDILARGFADLSTLPLRNLSADLIVQRRAVQESVPNRMGVMMPFSAQPITAEEVSRLRAEPGIAGAEGFLLLWNFGTGNFYTISGVPFESPLTLGPAKVREWLIKGRAPQGPTAEVLVEEHYGAFFNLEPGASVNLGGKAFVIAGIVRIEEGSQITASNYYMDLAQARALANLPPDAINQVFLKVATIEDTEAVKVHIASWLPQASVTSPDTMLQLFGGISQVVGRFRWLVVAGAAIGALLLISVLIYGSVTERRREAIILLTVGWTRREVRRQLTAEMVVQGIVGGSIGLGIVAAAMVPLSQISLELPGRMPDEDVADFSGGAFHSMVETFFLPVTTTPWHWLLPPMAAAAVSAALAWSLSARLISGSLWSAVKAD